MTTKQQRTPGPWHVGGFKEDGLGQVIAGDASYPVNGNQSLTVICLCKKEANAALIAASPELLSMLHHAVNIINQLPNKTLYADNEQTTTYKMASKMEAIIAKAEGR